MSLMTHWRIHSNIVLHRQHNACVPRFPVGITPKTFERILEIMASLEYTGPLCLSCDDTKVHATLRVYYDGIQKKHFLVGGTGDPLHIADPDHLRDVIATAKIEKATKASISVSFYEKRSSDIGTSDMA